MGSQASILKEVVEGGVRHLFRDTHLCESTSWKDGVGHLLGEYTLVWEYLSEEGSRCKVVVRGGTLCLS